MADKLLAELVAMEEQAGRSFIKNKLNDMGQRQVDLESGLGEVQQELESLDQEAVDAELVRASLGQVKDLFGELKPYEQRELMQLVLKKAEVNEREITLEVYALNEPRELEKVGANGDLVRMRPEWLPTPVSQRTFRFSFKCHLPSLIQLRHRETNQRIRLGTESVIAEWQHLLDDGVVQNRAELARRVGVSRARITQALAHT